MNQHAFDFDANARQSDPWTSHAAAENVINFGAKHIDVIRAALERWGPMTAHEIAHHTPLDSVQVARRLADMEKKGMAEPTGHCRSSATGRPERVWRVISSNQ